MNEDAKGGGYPTKVFFSFLGEVFGICAQVPVSFLALLWMPLQLLQPLLLGSLNSGAPVENMSLISIDQIPMIVREDHSTCIAALLPSNSTPCREHQVDLGWISSG